MNLRFATIRNVFLVGSGGVLGQLAAVVCMPVLTRLYLPESYGQWALLMSLALMAGTLASLRYELSILLPERHEEAANLFALCLALSVATAGAVGLLLLWAPERLVVSLGFSRLRPWFWSVPLLVAARGIHQACVSWYTRVEAFGRVSLITALLPLGTMVGQLGLAMAAGATDAGGLVLGSVIGHAIAAGAGMVLLVPGRPFPLRAVAWRSVTDVFFRQRKYPLFMTPYTIVSELRNRMAAFLFAAYGQSAALGYYVFSDKITRIPVTTATNALRPVFFQKAAAHRVENLHAPLLRSLMFINRLATPCFVLFWLAHADIFGWLFGPQWRDAGIYGVVLSLPMFISLHMNWLDRAMDVLGRQGLAFLLEAVFSILSVLMLIVGLIVCGSVFWGVLFQAATVVLYNIVWLIVFFRITGFPQSGLRDLVIQTIVLGLGCTGFYTVLASMLPAGIAVSLYLAAVAAWSARTLHREWCYLRRPRAVPQAGAKATDRLGSSTHRGTLVRCDGEHAVPAGRPAATARTPAESSPSPSEEMRAAAPEHVLWTGGVSAAALENPG